MNKLHSKTLSHVVLSIAAVVLFGAMAGDVAAQRTKPDEKSDTQPEGDRAVLREAVQQLTREAQQAMQARSLPTQNPDFASRFDKRIESEQVLPLLTERVHREPFVDAYVRWQLTSFNPDVSSMNDKAFRKLLQNAPRLMENPMADTRFIRIVERAADAEENELSGGDLRRLRQQVGERRQSSSFIEQMNLPASDFRAWMREKLGTDSLRGLQWLIENCATNIQAGWSVQGEKSRITTAFREAASNGNIAQQEKRQLAEQTSRLAGMHRRYVDNVNILANETVEASIRNTQVTRGDVQRWISLLAGQMGRRR